MVPLPPQTPHSTMGTAPEQIQPLVDDRWANMSGDPPIWGSLRTAVGTWEHTGRDYLRYIGPKSQRALRSHNQHLDWTGKQYWQPIQLFMMGKRCSHQLAPGNNWAAAF